MVDKNSEPDRTTQLQAADKMEKFRRAWTRWITWVYRRVPPGARTIVGLLVLSGGMLGFLPILGFWMIPLGLAIISLDFRPMIRARKRRARQT